MIIWILWEDQRADGVRGFGPHELLISCIADDLGGLSHRALLQERVRAYPKKGCNKILQALKTQLPNLADQGAVFAVFDRDQAHQMWGPGQQLARCYTALLKRIRGENPGDYEVIFLEQNVETLLDVCLTLLGRERPRTKPDPEERDRILKRVAYATADLRGKVRAEVPSFNRLVVKVVGKFCTLERDWSS